jgi:hypothetical protein
MADADRVALRYIQETTFGIKEPGNPAFNDIRFTGETLHHEVTSVNSEEIRSDRQTVGLAQTEIRAAGGLNFELSYGAFDDWLRASLLSSAWTAAAPMAGGPGVTIASNVITRDAGSFVTDGFVVGRFVKMTGWDTAGNNTIARVSAVTAATLTIVGVTLTNQASPETDVGITQGAYIQNGTSLLTYNIEREYTDLASEFELFLGMAIDQTALSVTAGQKITGSFEFIGSKGDSETDTAGDSSPTAASTNEIMTATRDVIRVSEGNAALPSTQFTFQLGNNLRQRLEIGLLGAASVGTGKVAVTGTLQNTYTTKTQIDKFRNFTSSDLGIIFQDNAASPNAYVLHMPAVKYTTGQRVTPGESQDVIADLAYSAFRDPTLGFTVQIARFPGP